MSRVVLGAALIVAVAVVLVIALLGAVSAQDGGVAQLERSGKVLESAQLTEREVVDLETGVRGYAATGDRVFLAPWAQARRSLPGHLRELRALTADSPGQSARAAGLDVAIRAYITGYTDPFVARPHPLRGPALVADTARGRRLLDAMRARFDRFDAVEFARQRAAEHRVAAGGRRVRILVIGAVALLLAFLLAFVAWVGTAIVAPLRRCSWGLGELVAGRQDLRLAPRGSGEVGLLARTFNRAAAQLAAREADLREAAELHRSVLQTAQQAYVAIDARGRIAAWNAAAERIFGYSAPEAIGSDMAELIIPESLRDTHRAGLSRYLSDGEPRVLDRLLQLSAVRRSGEEFPVELTIARVDRGGEVGFHAFLSDVSDRKRFEDELRHLADHDALTGLYNRHRFDSELERVVSETGRYDRHNALLMLDLDGFKHVNDRFGHPVGDELVNRIGGILCHSVRETDIIARLGGDEFAILLLQAGRDEAIHVAEKVLDQVRRRAVVVQEPLRARITTSIGISVFDGSSDASAEDLIVEADIAMYDAKANGRDRYAVYDRAGGRREVASKRHAWLERLKSALDEDHFVLHAQPITGICGNGIPRFELLLRMIDESGELIPPGAFLYNAERFDLMGQIDRWVLGQAVRVLHDHAQAGHDISLAVNLSGKTMNDDRLAAELAALLARYPIPEARLVIEVTETAAIVNINRARQLATELRTLGCRFALDDFGAGFASFYYLKHLRFDYLKIDGEFITQLRETPTDQLVVRAVVDIAKGLGTQTVAESVGDEDTVELLRELGVDYGQGFYLGHPGPLSDRLPALGAGAVSAS